MDNLSSLYPYEPQYEDMKINDHYLHHLPQISENRLFPAVHFDSLEFELLPQISNNRFFPKVHFDSTEFELYGGSSQISNNRLFPAVHSDLLEFELYGGRPTNTAVPPPSSLFLQNSEITNDFSCTDAMEAKREAIFRAAMMQPVDIDAQSIRPPPERKNVKISKDPQSVAARRRREKISHRMKILQKMVPGGMELDTASMLEEAANYIKFLKKEIELLEQVPTENFHPTDDRSFSG